MKRALAVILLVTTLGALAKLALTPSMPQTSLPAFDPASVEAGPSPGALLIAKYPSDATLVRRVLDRYLYNALAIEQTDGLRGLKLLDTLGIEAVYLYERRPEQFRRLRTWLGDQSAARILLNWREYFGLARAEPQRLDRLIGELARLSPDQRTLAAEQPALLPFLLAEPEGVSRQVRRWGKRVVVPLMFLDLSHGPAPLQQALKTLDDGALALEAFEKTGIEGFLLVQAYGPVLRAVRSDFDLGDLLGFARLDGPSLDELLQTDRPATVAAALRHLKSERLLAAAAGNPFGLRLSVEYGAAGDRALARGGPAAAGVVFERYPAGTLRRQAVEAIAQYGPAATLILDKYADLEDFRVVLQRDGAGVVPVVFQADGVPEALAKLESLPRRSAAQKVALAALKLAGDSGQKMIGIIRRDGLDRARSLSGGDVKLYQFLPGYDSSHLAATLAKGYVPTAGELTWAAMDGTFIVFDVLSLAALQPEGAVASEAGRDSLRAAARAGAREVEHESAHAVTGSAARLGSSLSARAARWTAVESAGGAFEVLRQARRALPRLSLRDMTELARPLAQRAGVRLAEWTPLQWIRDGVAVIRRIPPERGLKYVALQATQASVGLLALHKMEEHLAAPSAGPAPAVANQP